MTFLGIDLTIFEFEFMRNALIGALIVGFCAPAVGIFLVQKRLALIGDGIGHIALTGVAIGFLTSMSPMWTTLVTTMCAAVVMELMRRYSKTSGDVALALMFYGGLAGGVFLTGLVGERSSVDLHEFLFGSLMTTSRADLWIIGVGGGFVVALMLALRPWIAAICHDEEHARVAGLPVVSLNLLLMVTTAVVVSVSMRAVGLLLVSALLIIPVVTAQQFSRGFMATMGTAMALGFTTAGAGVVMAGLLHVPPGSTVVLLGIACFILAAILTSGSRRLRQLMVSRSRPNNVVPAAAKKLPKNVENGIKPSAETVRETPQPAETGPGSDGSSSAR